MIVLRDGHPPPSECGIVTWESVLPRINEMLEKADALGQREELERRFEWLEGASFFGRPSRTRVSRDFCDLSLYFEIDVLRPDGTWAFAMNGGLIFHSRSGEWSIHT